MGLTIQEPATWQRFSETGEESRRLQRILAGRFSSQIDPAVYVTRTNPKDGSVEIMKSDRTMGYSISEGIPLHAISALTASNVRAQNYACDGLIIVDTFAADEGRIAGFSWRRP